MKLHKLIYIFFFFCLVFESCAPKAGALILDTKVLEIEQLSPNTWVHRSFLDTKSYGPVPSNGMIYIHKGSAIIFDTPANLSATEALIEWLEKEKKVQIEAVVVGHFHEDCLVGLPLFHQKDIPSYGQAQTPALASGINFTPPKVLVEKEEVLDIGGQQVHLYYAGPGHAVDNMVGYIPAEKALFGGCLVKALGAGRGNLADADIKKWSDTVKKVWDHFPEVKYVVPGHGSSGDTALLDFTIDMFK